MNEQSITARSAGENGCGICPAFKMARVGFFHDDDALVLPQFPGELALADIHGKNFCRAVLQQAIGEAAGGRAEIKRDQAGDIELKMVQRVFEFVAAAADEFFAARPVRVRRRP